MKYLYLIWKNVMRKKLRTTLTVFSILFAFILFGLLNTLGNAFTQGAELAGADRLLTIHKVSLIEPLPYSYIHRAATVDGVKQVTFANWFGAYYQEQRNQFAQFAVDAESYLEVYADDISLPDEQREAWLNNRIGAVIGRALANRFDWNVGDRIPLIGMFPQQDGSRNWEFVIEGIFEATDQRGDTSYMMFHYDYFDEARSFGQGTIGWMIITVEDPDQAPQVAADIDALFANSPAETKTSTEQAFVESFMKQFGDIGAITRAILGAVFFTMLLVAGNTMAQSVRERIPELAILKTLGFSNTSVLLMVLAESLLLALIGGLLGLGLAWLMAQVVGVALAAYLPGFGMSGAVLVQGLLAIALLGLLAGILPALQGMRLNIITALGRRA